MSIYEARRTPTGAWAIFDGDKRFGDAFYYSETSANSAACDCNRAFEAGARHEAQLRHVQSMYCDDKTKRMVRV